MGRRNPGDEGLRALERRARAGDPQAEAALRHARMRVGDPKAEADVLAAQLREHPALDQQRAEQAQQLGALLEAHGVQPLIEQRVVKSELLPVPGHRNRTRLTLTYGFDPRTSAQWLGHQPPHFSVRTDSHVRPRLFTKTTQEWNAQMDAWRTRALPWIYPALARWYLAPDDFTGTRDANVQNGMHAASRANRGDFNVFTGWGAAPFDFLAGDPLAMDRGHLERLLIARLPLLRRAFLADLYAYDLARFPQDMPADQQPFVEARAQRAREREHDCRANAVPYEGEDGGHGWECGVCGAFLQAG